MLGYMLCEFGQVQLELWSRKIEEGWCDEEAVGSTLQSRKQVSSVPYMDK